MKTYVTKPADVERKWFVVNADGKVLGRLAAEAASILRGKKKPIYQPNVDAGDYVIIINAEKAVLSGLKSRKKSYYQISTGYVGHNRHIPYRLMKEKHPEWIVEHAIKGMLPHTTLGRRMSKKLRVYTGPKHEHEAQKPVVYEW
jgi:large subunit ribosomal protein L13